MTIKILVWLQTVDMMQSPMHHMYWRDGRGGFEDRFSTDLNRPSYYYNTSRALIDDLVDKTQLYPVHVSLLGHIIAPENTRIIPDNNHDRLVNSDLGIDLRLHTALHLTENNRRGLTCWRHYERNVAIPIFAQGSDYFVEPVWVSSVPARYDREKSPLIGYVIAPDRSDLRIGAEAIRLGEIPLTEVVNFAKTASHGLMWYADRAVY